MLLSVVWSALFGLASVAGFISAEIIIILMLTTALMMTKKVADAANKSELNGKWAALIGLRGGMSLYAGWLTAATVLGLQIMLKKMNVFSETNEEAWTLVLLWIAFVIYITTACLINDPLYATVLVWASFGILKRNALESRAVEINLIVVMGITSAFVAGFAVKLCKEAKQRTSDYG